MSMSFMRYLAGRQSPAVQAPQSPAAETMAVRHIVARLEALPPDRARFLAAMAYILARAAYADLAISDAETSAIESVLKDSGLDEAQAALVAEMAKLQEKTAGDTSDFLVTREFKELATDEERLTALRACYHVCVADDSISGAESSVLDEIANELDLSRADAASIRAEFADRLSARHGFPDPAGSRG
jgi:uncharacterized tellurite resistance protein B-like protein